MSQLPEHSPLGGSGAYRWLVCPGSVHLSEGVADEESEYAAEGTAAHTLGEHCLTRRQEPWQFIGRYIKGDQISEAQEDDGWVCVGKEMADAVAQYIATLELWHPDRNQGNSWIEKGFHRPSIHEYFYGRSDFVHLIRPGDQYVDQATGELVTAERTILHCWDYKHGAGIVVEATNNPQLRYYAAGIIEEFDLWDDVYEVVLHIFQPRGFHWQGPHRWETLYTSDLVAWLEDTCIPGMEHAMVSRETKTGSHCRFCPARQTQCSALMSDLAEFENLLLMAHEEAIMDPDYKDKSKLMTAEQLGRLIELEEVAKIAMKAAKARALPMLQTGQEVPGVKLVKSRTNREFKEGAEEAAIKQFGEDKAFVKPKLKSPTQVEAMPGGKEFTARWAFKPEGGVTIASLTDPRRPIKRDIKSLFKPVRKNNG